MSDMEGAKIYGLCLVRLKHQIAIARGRANGNGGGDRHLLESYCTADPEDIIDILELYDVGARSEDAVREKLDELAFTASVLMEESLSFQKTDEGYIGLYLS